MAFDGAGQEPGLEIWRIEDFEAVPLDKENYGKFHVGDSYIILKTISKGGSFVWNLHFWLGEETSQDEAGTAAIKSVELDESLGGVPVQHREVQDHESDLFASYFKAGGIKYLPGGVKSGFTHVDLDAEAVKRLFKVKGRSNVVKVKRVELSASSLNKSDSFVLDCGKGKQIFVYMPEQATRMERFMATKAANDIRDEDHAGNADVVIIDEFGEDNGEFFAALGEGSVNEVDENVDDVDNDEAPAILYKVSANSDTEVEISEVSKQPLQQEMLDKESLGSQDCFILNTGSTSGIFVWIGKESTKEERIQAMRFAEDFLAKSGLPKWTKIERIVENGEPAMFKQFFASWTEPEDSPFTGLGRVYPQETIAEWDVGALHAENRRLLAKSAGCAVGFMPDDSRGSKEIYRVENFELEPVDESLHGFFFGGDSYVIKYSYESAKGPGHIIYFWQGNESSQDERAASAINAVKMDNELNGAAVQVRVVQGCEPRHFLKMFGGKLVVFSGGKASGFRNIHDSDTYDVDGTRLFRIRATSSDDRRAVQVPEESSSLNSEDVFLLETPGKTFIWAGSASSEDEQTMAKELAPTLSPGRDLESLGEGSEPEEFWQSLGGQGDYSKVAVTLDQPILQPRLFHCIEKANGKLFVVEVHDFEQADLDENDVMILDSGAEIYVWMGKLANDNEKEKSLELAKKYLQADPTTRNEENTLVFKVNQGQEPSSFTCTFPAFQ